MQMIPVWWQKVKRNWRASWWGWKRRLKKSGLKLNIQKTKIMASGPITSWQIDGGKVETVTEFIFLGSKITEDSDCSHEIKRCLLFGRKAMTNLSSVQFISVAQSCPTLCDPMNCSMTGLPVHHQLLEFTQTHIHQVGDAIQPSHPLSRLLLLPPISPSIRVFPISQLFTWGGQSTGVSALASFLPKNIQGTRTPQNRSCSIQAQR